LKQDELAARVATKQPVLPRSRAKVPVFNLDKDKSTFYKWNEKWDAYLTVYGLNQIQDEAERKKWI
jgi:hypothetical protein